MNVRLDGEIGVTLSERNLRDLLGQVENPGTNPWTDGEVFTAQLVRTCALETGDVVFLRVQVEPDEYHYGKAREGTNNPQHAGPGGGGIPGSPAEAGL